MTDENHPEGEYTFKDPHSGWVAEGIHRKISDETLLEIIQTLCRGGVVFDWSGLLLQACWKGSDRLIQKFVEMGADIEVKSNLGSTPLLFTAERGNLSAFKFLIERGANLYAKNTLKVPKDAESYASDLEDKTLLKYIQDLKALAMKQANDFIRDKDAIIKKNRELEDKIEFLMEQMGRLQCRDAEPEERLRKKPRTQLGHPAQPTQPTSPAQEPAFSMDLGTQ